jgi:hypothetical protein
MYLLYSRKEVESTYTGKERLVAKMIQLKVGLVLMSVYVINE